MPTQPEPEALWCAWWWLGCTFLDLELVEPVAAEALTDDQVVVASIEGQQLDVREQPLRGDSVEGWLQQDDVVAVRSVDGNTDRDAVGVSSDRPLVTEFAPVNRAFAGCGSSSSSSVSLVLLDAASSTATFGDQVTFSVSTSVSTKWVVANCYQGGRVVYSETRGFFPSYPWGQTFTLGPTGYWTSGAADCTAELFTTSRKGNVTLATSSFTVDA